MHTYMIHRTGRPPPHGSGKKMLQDKPQEIVMQINNLSEKISQSETEAENHCANQRNLKLGKHRTLKQSLFIAITESWVDGIDANQRDKDRGSTELLHPT